MTNRVSLLLLGTSLFLLAACNQTVTPPAKSSSFTAPSAGDSAAPTTNTSKQTDQELLDQLQSTEPSIDTQLNQLNTDLR